MIFCSVWEDSLTTHHTTFCSLNPWIIEIQLIFIASPIDVQFNLEWQVLANPKLPLPLAGGLGLHSLLGASRDEMMDERESGHNWEVLGEVEGIWCIRRIGSCAFEVSSRSRREARDYYCVKWLNKNLALEIKNDLNVSCALCQTKPLKMKTIFSVRLQRGDDDQISRRGSPLAIRREENEDGGGGGGRGFVMFYFSSSSFLIGPFNLHGKC